MVINCEDQAWEDTVEVRPAIRARAFSSRFFLLLGGVDGRRMEIGPSTE
jgi:hypothetical protein